MKAWAACNNEVLGAVSCPLWPALNLIGVSPHARGPQVTYRNHAPVGMLMVVVARQLGEALQVKLRDQIAPKAAGGVVAGPRCAENEGHCVQEA